MDVSMHQNISGGIVHSAYNELKKRKKKKKNRPFEDRKIPQIRVQ